MKNISLYFIRRPILVNVILVLTFILGGYYAYKVPKEAFPAVSINQILIVTKYPGASAKDVELNVTAKIEEKIDKIGNIKEYRSSSTESLSNVIIFADDDLNDLQFNDLLSDVRAEVDKIDDFPSDIEGQPVITSVTTEDRPIIEIAFSGDYNHLKTTLHEIENDLRKISGISNVTLVGLPDEEIYIEVDPDKAQSKEIDLNSIYFAINTRNQVGTGGTLESFISQKKIVSFNKYEEAEDVLDTVIRMSPDGQGVFLKDIATISYGPKEDKLIVRNNGSRGASLLLAIRSGVDQLKISDKVREYLKNKQISDKITYKINNDLSNNARSKFALLKNNGIMGFLLVILILFYFLNGKSAFWTAFGIPFTILGSMIIFVPMGMTLSSISIGSFVIILGMIVDDATVISERYSVNIEAGQTPEEAASNAVGRLWKPVLASSLTTVIAFMPLLSLGGLPGKFVWQMPVVVIIALFISLIESYLLLPAHLAHGKIKKQKFDKNRIVLMGEKLYGSLLTKSIKYRYFVILFFFVIFLGSVFVGATKVRKDSFPQEASEGFTIQVTLKKGFSPEKVEEIISDLEKSILELKTNELVGYTARLGTHSLSSLTNNGTEEHLVSFLVYLTPYSDRDRTALDIVDDLKQRHQALYDSAGFALEFDLMRIGPPLGEPIEIIISSNSDKERFESSAKTIDFLKNISGVTEVKDDQIQGKDEINLRLNYKKVAQAGLTPVDIIRTLRIAFDGQIVTDYSSINNSYDFRLRLNDKFRGDFDFISKLPIANKRGQLIKLNTMIDYEERPSLSEIKHYNGIRSTSVTGNIDPKKTTAIEILKYFSDKFIKNKNVSYTISGRPIEEAKIFSGLKSAAIIAIIGIYLVLSLIFNSYFRPFLVLMVVPFGVVGVFLAFWTHNLSISMFAGIGLIGLSGIVVNNAIVLIDNINELLKNNGAFSQEILVEGAKERFRPILLTTLTTILGIAPTGYAIGGYDSLLSPLSLAILYGLLFGTVVVLIFIPSLYAISNDLHKVVNSRAKNLFKAISSIIIVTVIVNFNIQDAHAEEKITIQRIYDLIHNTNETKIQNESLKQSEFYANSIDGMLDSKLNSKFFIYSSENYSQPPMSFDSTKEGYGLTLDYEKLTSYGVRIGAGIGVEDKSLATIPANNQFGLNAMDSVYRFSLAIPLYRNFGSAEYHLNKEIAFSKKEVQTFQSSSSQEKQFFEAMKSFWNIIKLEYEIEIAESSLERFVELHKLNVSKRNSSIISNSEFLLSEVEITTREKLLTFLKSEVQIEKLNLQKILELDESFQIEKEKMKAYVGVFKSSNLAIESLIENGNAYGQLVASEELFKKLQVLEKEKTKSNLDFFISIKSFGRGDDINKSLTENISEKHEVYAGISWDFDLGNKANISSLASAASKEQQATFRKHQTRFQLLSLFKTLKQKMLSNDEQIKLLNTITNKQFKILAEEKSRFKNGRITTLDYIKLQEAYEKSILQIISLEYLNEITALNLYFSLGNIKDYLKEYL